MSRYVAVEDWKGPHQVDFLKALESDYVDQYALENLLRNAANNWAQVWVDAMNEESRARHDRTVKDADSAWEWLALDPKKVLEVFDTVVPDAIRDQAS